MTIFAPRPAGCEDEQRFPDSGQQGRELHHQQYESGVSLTAMVAGDALFSTTGALRGSPSGRSCHLGGLTANAFEVSATGRQRSTRRPPAAGRIRLQMSARAFPPAINAVCAVQQFRLRADQYRAAVLTCPDCIYNLGGSPPQARYIAVNRFVVLSGLARHALSQLWSGLNATRHGPRRSSDFRLPDSGVSSIEAASGLITQDRPSAA
jgi:hypothetical protein